MHVRGGNWVVWARICLSGNTEEWRRGLRLAGGKLRTQVNASWVMVWESINLSNTLGFLVLGALGYDRAANGSQSPEVEACVIWAQYSRYYVGRHYAWKLARGMVVDTDRGKYLLLTVLRRNTLTSQHGCMKIKIELTHTLHRQKRQPHIQLFISLVWMFTDVWTHG